jgi:hypothetical protein
MTGISHLLISSAPWALALFVLFSVTAVMYGLFTDHEPRSTRGRRDELSPSEQLLLWRRGTR